MYVQAKGGRGGKDGRDNCTRVYSGTGEVLGIDDGKEGGVESFLRPQKFGKKLQRYFIHIVKKKNHEPGSEFDKLVCMTKSCAISMVTLLHYCELKLKHDLIWIF